MNQISRLRNRLFSFGHCRRCTRLSAILAVLASTAGILALLILGQSILAWSAVVIAGVATALWMAHWITASRNGTLYTLLRTLEATPRDAKAIAAILSKSLHVDESGNARLPPGGTVTVTSGVRPGCARDTITRVVLMRGSDILAGAVATGPVGFRALDLARPLDLVRDGAPTLEVADNHSIALLSGSSKGFHE